jgi:hypothetical protein
MCAAPLRIHRDSLRVAELPDETLHVGDMSRSYIAQDCWLSQSHIFGVDTSYFALTHILIGKVITTD